MQPTGSFKPRRHLGLSERSIGSVLNLRLRRLKAGEGAEDLVHRKLAFIGSGQMTMP